MDDREWVDAEPAEAVLGGSRARVLRVVREAGDTPLGVREIAERARDDLGDSLTKRTGRNVRPPGRLER